MDTSFLLGGLASALSFYIIYCQLKVFSYWKSRGIKGPKPWPFVGTNGYYILRNRTEVDQEWFKTYGKIYGIYEGMTPVLRVSDNEIVKHVYIREFSSFTDRNSKNIYGESVKRWMFWSEGKHWSNQRALITPIFTSSKMKFMFNPMIDCTKNFMREVSSRILPRQQDLDEVARAKAIAKNAEKATFSKDELMSFAVDTIARSFFGLKLDCYKDKNSDFYKRGLAFSRFNVPWFLFWLIVPRPLAKYFEIDLAPKYMYEYFDKLSQSMIDDRRSKSGSVGSSFIDQLLEAELPTDTCDSIHTKEDDREAHYNNNLDHVEMNKVLKQQTQNVKFRKFDDIEIRAHATFFFLAGFETTSSSIGFCIYCLAHNPEAQEEVYQELMSNKDLLKDGKLDYTELSKMKKLDAMVAESLRIFSPVTEHNRVVTSKESVVLPTNPPLKLEPGTVISVPAFVLQRDPDYFENPLKFDMTRFYPENKENLKPCSYMPFGLGPRNCAGMRFALLNMKQFLAEILLNYKIVTGPKSHQNPPDFNRHAFFLQLKHTDFKLVPRNIEVVGA